VCKVNYSLFLIRNSYFSHIQKTHTMNFYFTFVSFSQNKIYFYWKKYIYFLVLRLCLLGSNCDMFQYSDTGCSFMPHNPMKNQNLFRVIPRDTATTAKKSVYVLQCSTPYENVLKNNDPFTQAYEGILQSCYLT
jgi:hypothetical protein